MIEKVLSRSMRIMFTGGVVASIGFVALPATAQVRKIKTVVVTGTRITTPATTANSPISSISAELNYFLIGSINISRSKAFLEDLRTQYAYSY